MRIVIEREEEAVLDGAFSSLEQFRDWYFALGKMGNFTQIPLSDLVCFLDGLSALTLCRRGAYQVELLLGQSGYSYKATLLAGQFCYATYRGGHIRMNVNGGQSREWNPTSYLQEHPEVEGREEASMQCGEGAFYREGDEFHLSFGEEGGAILVFSVRDVPYKSCLESIELIDEGR